MVRQPVVGGSESTVEQAGQVVEQDGGGVDAGGFKQRYLRVLLAHFREYDAVHLRVGVPVVVGDGL